MIDGMKSCLEVDKGFVSANRPIAAMRVSLNGRLSGHTMLIRAASMMEEGI